jgi:photosystem II stability/assembly factor-like uncharacterized protein
MRATILASALALLTGLLGSVAPTAASPPTPAYQWGNVAVGGGGYVDGLVFNPAEPGLAYARTDIGGAYRWDAVRRRWTPLMDFTTDYNTLGVQSIATDPIHPNRVWVAAGEYAQTWAGNGVILRSTDQGRHWQSTPLPIQLASNQDGRGMGERLVVDPREDTVLYLATPVNGLWHSTDGGVTWSQLASFPVTSSTDAIGLPFVTFGAASGPPGKPASTIYVGDATTTGTTLYASTDGGTSWQPVPGAPTGLLPQHAVPAGDGSLYLDYADQPGPNGMTRGAVYRYWPATGQWRDITPETPGANGNPAFGYAGLAVDPRHPDTVLVATNDRWAPVDDIYRSTDGGSTWSSVAATATVDASSTPFLTFGSPTAKFGWWISAIAIDPFNADHVVYGTGATVFGSYDATHSTTHWSSSAVTGIEETAVNGLVSPPAGPCKLVSVLGDVGGFCHRDLGRSPADGMSAPILGSGTGVAEAGHAPLDLVRVGWSGGDYSADGGATWTAMTLPPGNPNGAGTVGLSADGSTVVWSPSGSGPVYSTDKGATWIAVTGLPSGLTPVADPLDPTRWYAVDGSTGTGYRSTDDGHSFAVAASGLPTGSDQVHVTPGRTGDLWLSTPTGLYRSTDGGTTYAPIAGVTASQTLGFGASAPHAAYSAIYQVAEINGVTGIYRSTDTGRSWLRINDDNHNYGYIGQSITGDPRVFGRVYVATNGRGIVLGQPREG